MSDLRRIKTFTSDEYRCIYIDAAVCKWISNQENIRVTDIQYYLQPTDLICRFTDYCVVHVFYEYYQHNLNPRIMRTDFVPV